MNLFDECKIALGKNFLIPNTQWVEECRNLIKLHSKLNYINFNELSDLKSFLILYEKECFCVFVDNSEIPVFSSKLFAIIDNIYDILCLSNNVFFVNDSVIIKSLFPSFSLRVFMVFDSELESP